VDGLGSSHVVKDFGGDVIVKSYHVGYFISNSGALSGYLARGELIIKVTFKVELTKLRILQAG